MKTISVEIPDGKRAEWIDGVLTLVDDKPKDITERIKTFGDACKWCKENGKIFLCSQYERISELSLISIDLLAYLKLCIITAALNEGWEPTFAEDEERYNATYVFANRIIVDYECENVWANTSHRMVFKSKELALYAATQFRDIYADFCGCKKGGGE